MATYSFQDVVAAITGPGGSFNLGYGAGNAEEGISISMASEKSSMQIGADGSGMHSLHASKAGRITVRLLKTSPVNQQLMDLYNFQTASAANHGQNTITVRDIARGDVQTGRQAAFVKVPDITYASNGNTHEWVFDCIKIDQKLGTGTPAAF